MIIAIYIIISALALLYLTTRLRETHFELQRVRGQRDAYARALELAGHALPGSAMAAITDGQPDRWPGRRPQ
jgi:hypothetical protein